MEAHEQKTAGLAAEVRGFYDRKEHFRIYHGSTSGTRQMAFYRDKIVDTSQFNSVVRINRLKRTAFCEPNVAMDKLVRATMKSGMIPQVVMEFPGITVGGGFAGTSGESSSFKYGFFENTVNWIEIVLANGDIVTASKDERADLFEAAAGSLGTLGVMTLLAVQLIEVKPYVRLDIFPVHSVSQCVIELEKAAISPASDFVDAIVFGQELSAVMVGQLTKNLSTELEVVQFTRRSDDWFYIFVEKRLALDKQNTLSIAVPIMDYLFRYDRGCFWGIKYSFDYFCVPFNRTTRYILDPLVHSRVAFHALHESGLASRNIVQDIAFPSSTVGNFIDYLDRDFGYFPLWLCPLRKGHPIPLRLRIGSAEGDKVHAEEMPINVGVWGPGPNRELEFINFNRRIEKKTKELCGAKSLYARSYYTEAEFWDIYDKEWYDSVREKYHATTMPSVYDKISFDMSSVKMEPPSMANVWPLIHLPAFWDIWPMAGLYGALMAILGLYLPVWKSYVLTKRWTTLDKSVTIICIGLGMSFLLYILV